MYFPLRGKVDYDRYITDTPFIQNGENQSLAEAKLGAAEVAGGSQAFKSSHWQGHPNVLAHTRVDDRTDSRGRKLLFVEEIQSDLHQAGKKGGYRQRGEPEAARQALRDATAAATAVLPPAYSVLGEYGNLGYHNGWDAIAALVDSGVSEEQLTRDYDNITPGHMREVWQAVEAQRQLERADQTLADAKKAKVPDAPFKAAWPELVIKRLLRYAAEHGYDGLAWTTGDQQAERYDLSHHVDRIEYDDGDGRLTATRGGHDVVSEQVRREDLPDYLGRDVTTELFKNPSGSRDVYLLEGDQLRVGGAGMRGFYDDILPKVVNKYVKQWGAKAGTTHISQAPSG